MSGLRPETDWAAVRSCFDRPLYDDAAVLALFAYVGPPEEHEDWVEPVRLRLFNITADFAFDLWHELQPNSSAVGDQARRLADACDQVLKTVGSGEAEPSPENIYPFFGYGGLYAAAKLRHEPQARVAVINSLRAVYLLKQDAEAMAVVEARAQRIHRTPEGRPEEVAKKKLVVALAKLYSEAWKTDPGITVEPPGPFVRLLLHVAGALKERLGQHSFSYSASSFDHIWRRLDEDDKSKPPILPESWKA